MLNFQIKAKPLTVNKVWQGRRFKTKAYKDYEKEMFYLLKDIRNNQSIKDIKGHVEITLEFFLKYASTSDVDNFVKPLLDILVKDGIIEDDKNIMHLDLYKYKSDTDYMNITINKWTDD